MKRIFYIVVICGLLAGCSKFGDTNNNPTLLKSASTNALLTNSLQAMSDLVFGNVASSRLAALYVQHLAEGPYPGPSLYNDRNLSFTTWYAGSGSVTPPSNTNGPLFNLQTIINYNEEGNISAVGNGSKNNQIAVARILKSFYFLLMTDKWGDIPYSEALQAGKNYSPKYDNQKDIYYGIFKELTEAVAQINETEASVKGDILLNGNMAAWKRFANTQRMIMALRLSKADPAKGKTEYAAALSAGVITSNAQNIMYTFLAGDPNNYNPWYNNYTVSIRNDYAISSTLANYMSAKSDPRLPVYGEVLSNGQVKGLPYGLNKAVNIPAAYSRIGSYFRSQGSAMPIFTYAQVLFMQAEAAKIGYTAGGDAEAEAKYKDAIKASLQQYSVYTDAAYNAYMAQVAYVPAKGLEQIITEKWVHSYLNSWESWNDWRRTGFPVLTAAQDAVDSRGIPLRIGYPTTEQALNGANYKSAVAAMGGTDDNYAKMWWLK